MKLSDNTISILKNFSRINNSILVNPGNKLRTISVARNIFAEAVIEENFSKQFAIYDLNEFLNGLSLHKNPDLIFDNDSYLTIVDQNWKAKYFFSDPNLIFSPPDKEIKIPSKDVCFQLDSSSLDKLIRAASVYQLPDLAAVGNDGKIHLVVRDKKSETSNEYSIFVGETESEFVFNFKIENIKIISGSYDVIISSKLSAQFTNQKHNLYYIIALEPDSTSGN